MNEKKQFIPVSEHFIVPQNGNVLIKCTIPKLSSLVITSRGKKDDYAFSDIEIIGTSVDRFKIGDKVIVDGSIYSNPNYKVEAKYNSQSFITIRDHVTSLKDKDYKDFVKNNSSIKVEELFIIPMQYILAIIDDSKRSTIITPVFNNIIKA